MNNDDNGAAAREAFKNQRDARKADTEAAARPLCRWEGMAKAMFFILRCMAIF